MNKAGKSVLWFLTGCLVFTQGIISIAANYSQPIDGGWLLLFGFCSLTVVLSILFLMFRINPAFITAERNDLVPLSLIQHVASNTNNPRLLSQLIATISPEIWNNGGPDVDDEDPAETELISATEIDEAEEEETDVTDFTNAFQSLFIQDKQG
jgi:hypothetical protein